MVLDDERIRKLKAELLEDDIRRLTEALKQTGVEKQEALCLIEQYWEADENE